MSTLRRRVVMSNWRQCRPVTASSQRGLPPPSPCSYLTITQSTSHRYEISRSSVVAVLFESTSLSRPVKPRHMRAKIDGRHWRPTNSDVHLTFLPRNAMLARYMLSSCAHPSVRSSICLSQVGVLLKRLNLGSCKQHRTIAQGHWRQRSWRNFDGVTPNRGG